MAIDPAAIGSVDEAVDYLYGLEPERFVAARNEVAKSLRGGGNRDDADAVKALRKPTVLAAELNRVLRSAPVEVAALLEAASAVAAGHRSVLQGETVDLGTLRSAHREAACALAASALRDRDRLQELLEAASLDPDQHDELRAAAFATEPTPAVGFDLFTPEASSTGQTASVTSIESARARRRRKSRIEADGGTEDQPDGGTEAKAAGGTEAATAPRAPRRELGASAQRRAAETIAAAATEQQRAETSLTVAYRRVEAAARKLGKAAERIDELERRLVEAREHHEQSERALVSARAAADLAEQRLSASADALRAARAAEQLESADSRPTEP